MQNKWYKNAIGYEIFLKSFYDSDGDGAGDLKGVIQKLPYLKSLGVDIVWFMPIFKSPLQDLGYDVSDFKALHEESGTLEDFDELIKEANKLNIKIMMDLTPNHISIQHEWFQKALKGEKKYQDYFIWTSNPSKDSRSIYGESAWSYSEEVGKYYYHTFASFQPDLNWENPKVRREFEEISNFWMDRGVKGFRIDAVKNIGKDIHDGYCEINIDKLHSYIRQWVKNSFSKYDDIYTVTEGWGPENQDYGLLYCDDSRGEFNSIFAFEHLTNDWHEKWVFYKPSEFDQLKLKKVINNWQTKFKNKSWNTSFWGNHDMGRTVSRWGNDKEYWKECATTLAITQFMLQATPWILQGDEIGMKSAYFPNLSDYKDIQAHGHYQDMVINSDVMTHDEFLEMIKVYGRDNAKTPVQWTGGGNAGFTTATPWAKIPESYKEINIESQLKEKDSIINWYKWLSNFRKKHEEMFVNGDCEILNLDEYGSFHLHWKLNDEDFLILSNWTDFQLEINANVSEYKLIKSTHKTQGTKLKPWESRIYKK